MVNNYRILADGHIISNDTWQTGLNNNDLIIGPSGAGKTRGYVNPEGPGEAVAGLWTTAASPLPVCL